MEPLLDTPAAAKLLGTSERHIRYLVAKRRIPFTKLGDRSIRFEPARLNKWVEENRTEAVT